MGSVHLLYGSVLCTLPLTSGGVGIGLEGSRRLATSAHVVCSSWSAPAHTELVSVPQLTKFFANFRFQLLQNIINAYNSQVSFH